MMSDITIDASTRHFLAVACIDALYFVCRDADQHRDYSPGWRAVLARRVRRTADALAAIDQKGIHARLIRNADEAARRVEQATGDATLALARLVNPTPGGAS